VDTQNSYIRFHTWQQYDSNGYNNVFGISDTNGACIYTVRLNWKEPEAEIQIGRHHELTTSG